MKLFCSSKLQKKLGCKLEKIPTPADPLDHWYANLITLGLATTIVAVLPDFRFCVILSDIQPEDWAYLSRILRHAIREALRTPYYGIPQCVIDRYIPEDAVFDFCAAADESVVRKAEAVTAGIAAADVPSLWDRKAPSGYNLWKAQLRTNSIRFFSEQGNCEIAPWQALKGQLTKAYGMATPAFQVEVSLDLEQHVARRTFRVAADIPFLFLAAYVHAAFRWTLTAFHEFILPPVRSLEAPLHIVGSRKMCNSLPRTDYHQGEEYARLSDYLTAGSSFLYHHYPDGPKEPKKPNKTWAVQIQVTEYIPSTEEPLPVCTLCEGDAKPDWRDEITADAVTSGMHHMIQQLFAIFSA